MERTTVNRRYRVDTRIGEGGMAEVYLGRDLLLNRAVAIKALRPQFASDATFRARFQREAQAAAGFTHPNIIDIYDVGEERGTPYIVMEYVRGETLKEIIEQEGPFAADDVAALLEQVAAALDYAHERGLVHRDVKPQNILVDGNGLAKVVDFGIAKGLADSNLTDVGTGMGTVHYISPEQASGLMATPASDVYSLAVVAFEMLTKELPFAADSAVGIAMRHIHDDPPRPSSLNPDLPAAVDALVRRGLAKDPTQRYPSAGAFANAMSDWRSYAASSPARPSRPAPSSDPSPSAVTRSMPAAQGSAAQAGSRSTMVAPRPAAAARSAPVSGAWHSGAATPPRRPAATTTTRRDRDHVGCGAWIYGTIGLVGIVALVWLGFQLSPRFANLGSAGRGPTATAAVATRAPEGAAVVSNPSPTPTAVPTIAPAATPTITLVPVPDLRGTTIDQATEHVTNLGLLIQEGDRVFDDRIPVDAVAEQDPDPSSRVPQGTTVVVKLSQGSSTIDLRTLNLSGMDPDQAQKTLADKGLNVEQDQVHDASVPAGRVVGVDPSDAATVGDTVTLHVSAGDKIQIPGAIQGQPTDQAIQQLQQLGLVVVNQIGVNRATIVGSGVNLDQAGIRDHDVVGVQDNGAAFGAWVPPGTKITVVYYDQQLDNQ